ncbi:MAG: hypothetical protein DME26_09145 [Verrucomicrobia bacterium]|nr:MAG: hypothetical protein DME26_09145 [Verrucomicrobiota bacterium]
MRAVRRDGDRRTLWRRPADCEGAPASSTAHTQACEVFGAVPEAGAPIHGKPDFSSESIFRLVTSTTTLSGPFLKSMLTWQPKPEVFNPPGHR